MKWIMSSMHYFYYPFDYFLKCQKELGIAQIDFYGCMPHIWVDHYTYHGCVEIRKLVESQEQTISLFTPKPYNYCIYAPDEPHGAFSEQYYQNCIHAAKALGVNRMSLSFVGGYRDISQELLLEKGIERLNRLVQLASDQEVTILLEISTSEESALLDSIQKMKHLMNVIGSDATKILVNMQAVRKNGETLEQWSKEFGTQIGYVRFHNEIDPAALQSAHYEGPWGVCVSDDSWWDNPREKDKSLLRPAL